MKATLHELRAAGFAARAGKISPVEFWVVNVDYSKIANCVLNTAHNGPPPVGIRLEVSRRAHCYLRLGVAPLDGY